MRDKQQQAKDRFVQLAINLLFMGNAQLGIRIDHTGPWQSQRPLLL